MITFKQWLKGVGKYDLACIAGGGLIGWVFGGSNGILVGALVGSLIGVTYAMWQI